MARPHHIPLITDDRALGGSVIKNSLRFNSADNTYLSRSFASNGNRQTFTISCWVKKSHPTNRQVVMGQISSVGSNEDGFEFDGTKIRFYSYVGGSFVFNITTNSRYLDVNGWYHLVAVYDSPQATASNRAKVFVNGERVTDLSTATYPSQNNTVGFLNTTTDALRIGNMKGNIHKLDGYMAEINFIDGIALDPSYFGYTDFQTGLWRPKKYEGTYGTNGFHLEFKDNSGTTATTLGRDSSGNGSNFTPSNFSVAAGQGNDSLEDTPTNNYPTLNSLDMGATNISHLVYSNGNLQVKGASGVWASTRATFAVSSGKWYWEVKILSAASFRPFIGVIQSDVRLASNQTEQSNELGVAATGIAYWVGASSIRGGTNTSGTTTNVPSCTVGDIVGVALDMDNKKVYFSKNGTFFASQDPANNAGEIIAFSTSMQTATIAPAVQSYNGTDEAAFNFGQRPFSYTPPTGYKKLNSNNLPVNITPTILKPEKHFTTVTWTGNNTAGRLIPLEFKPDFVWVKCRSTTHDHQITDSVRGTSKALAANTTGVEEDWDVLYSGNNKGMGDYVNGGFILDDDGNNARYNNTGQTYVAWCWKGGGAAVTNNDGSIASQVSVNTEAGFSITGWTGTGSNATVGHGLGSAPQFIITKQRSTAGHHWRTYHKSVGATRSLYLDLNNAQSGTDAGFMNNTEPTSTVFSIGNDTNINENSQTHIAYCWTEIPGYSKFGQYTGNGNANGPFVFTGFRPAWVMIKMSGYTGNWIIFDNKRDPFNYCDTRLFANLNNADTGSYNVISMLSNGFKFQNQYDGSWNRNATTFIYLAFAEKTGVSPYGTESNPR